MLGNCLGGEWRLYLQLSQPPSNVPDGGGGGDYDDGGDDDDGSYTYLCTLSLRLCFAISCEISFV